MAKKQSFYLKIIYVCFLFYSCDYNTCIASATTSVAKTEEGWRYRSNFMVKITHPRAKTASIDLSLLHDEMGLVTREANRVLREEFSGASKKKDEEVKVACTIRIIPIILEGDQIFLRDSVKLTDAFFIRNCGLRPTAAPLSFYEHVCVSGFADTEKSTKGLMAKYAQVFHLTTVNDWDIRNNAFCLLPAFNPDDKKEFFCPLAFKFLQRAYIDPALFERNVRFRYPENPQGTCFEGGNYGSLQVIHQQAIKQLQDRKAFIAGKLQEFAVSHDVDEISSFVESSRRSLKEFHNVVGANSYSCAEQTVLDYMRDVSVLRSLKTALNVDNGNVIGLLINVHSTDTPCSTCITSLARESQDGGTLKELSNGKPVGIVCSCANHYDRKPPMVPYSQTTWLQGATFSGKELGGDIINPYQLNIPDTATVPVPFSLIPVVLLKFDEAHNHFAIDTQSYLRFIKAQAAT